MKFAREYFKNSKVDGSGVAYAAHMRQFYASTGEPMPEDLDPDPPVKWAYHWRIYRRLSQGRRYTGMGDPMPLNSADFVNYQLAWSVEFDPWELEMFEMIDALFFTSRKEEDNGGYCS